MSRVMINLILGAGVGLVLILSALLGSSDLALPHAVAALLGGGDATAHIIVWEIRLPRALAAVGVGAALGASGALTAMSSDPQTETALLSLAMADSVLEENWDE